MLTQKTDNTMSVNISKNKGTIPNSKVEQSSKESLRLNSFFAGIGGFDIGFERAGIVPVYHCEKDLYCQNILKKHWPDAVLHADVISIDPESLPLADVWTGGFPCQDVSVARGSLGRDGLRGTRSGLFYAFSHLIEARLPKVVLIENVTGLLNSHRGCDFHTVIRTLTDLGYGVAWRVMNSRYFGSPQSRPRVFVCAWLGSVEFAVNALYESTPGHVAENERRGFLTPSYDHHSGVVVPEVAYCLAATSGRHTGTDWSRSYVSYYDRVRRLTPGECEGLQGFPTGWTVPAKQFRKLADDVDTLRYHALGNAVCVPVAEWIARRIAAGLSDQKKVQGNIHLNGREQKDLKNLLPVVPGTAVRYIPLESAQKTFIEADRAYKWSTGGCAVGTSAVTASVPAGPSVPMITKLIEVIDKSDVDDWYFLSPNAAEGILRRVKSQGRTLFGPLTEALERLAERKQTLQNLQEILIENELMQVAVNA